MKINNTKVLQSKVQGISSMNRANLLIVNYFQFLTQFFKKFKTFAERFKTFA
jgi:hypothetical protein